MRMLADALDPEPGRTVSEPGSDVPDPAGLNLDDLGEALARMRAGLLHAAWRGRGTLRAGDRIPFGPALALGGWIGWLHGALTWQ